MRNRKRLAVWILSAVIMAATPVTAVSAAGASETVQLEARETVKPGWIKKNGKYYWRLADGSIIKRRGIEVLNGKKYYIDSGGSRAQDCWRVVDGKGYFFQKNGVMYEKKGWFEWRGNQYHINSDGSRKSGLYTIKNRLRYFDKYGRLVKNKRIIKIWNRYYTINEKGYVTKLSNAEGKCILETQKFIKDHTNSGMSKEQKFRACFNHLLWYMRYHVEPFDAFQDKDWPYKIASGVWNSYLTGDCYGFACCVAACAKELGYQPYVVITTGDHAFVMIDGLYYDNMGPLFGAGSHFAYNTLHKVKF